MTTNTEGKQGRAERVRIREWAASQGKRVGDRGRISMQMLADYRAANPDQPNT